MTASDYFDGSATIHRNYQVFTAVSLISHAIDKLSSTLLFKYKKHNSSHSSEGFKTWIQTDPCEYMPMDK